MREVTHVPDSACLRHLKLDLLLRETARRKLSKLERLDRLRREENYWRLAMGGNDVIARRALSEPDDSSTTLAATLFVSLSEIVEDKTTLLDK